MLLVTHLAFFARRFPVLQFLFFTSFCSAVDGRLVKGRRKGKEA